MIAELGNFTLSLALVVILLQSIIPFFAYKYDIDVFHQVSKRLALVQFIVILISYICLTTAFLQNDFSVRYVASNSNTLLPLLYKFSAVWGAHEGSLLLWMLILSSWNLAVAYCSKRMPANMTSLILGVMALITLGFLLFVIVTSNPFERLFPVPIEGRDLNPLLQDFGLAIHPPMLYMGYVGFSVAFSFAIAGLINGKVDAAWAKWARPWTNAAWAFLTIGIVLGSWWAYYELGWGGWWFWDPVENASFLPWLAGTALLHSLSATEKRGAFISWTLLLCISAFSLSLLGTFLVRSGILTSVHSFASDPERGLFILIYLLVVVGGSLLLYTTRVHKVQSNGVGFSPVSRESGILFNNIILYVSMLSIMLGTLYPLIIDALNLGKISVGPPYFNAIFTPLMLILAIGCGVGSSLRWKEDKISRFKIPAIIIGVLSIISTIIVFMFYKAVVITVVGVLLAFWVIIATLYEWSRRWFKNSNPWQAIRSTPAAVNGMVIAHIGFGICILGVTLTSFYSVEKDIRLQPGESYTISDYQFTFQGVKDVLGPNYESIMATIDVEKGDYQVSLTPEKRDYFSHPNTMTEADIDAKIHRDVYVALGSEYQDNSWSLRLYYKPYIRFVWLGGLLMAFGGIVAMFDRRYRKKEKDTSTKVSEMA